MKQRVKANFSDCDLGGFDILPVPPEKGIPIEAESQTEAILAADSAAQTTSVSEGSCQTEDHSQRGVGTPEEGKDSEESKAGESKAGEGGDIEQVMSMLRRVTPDMVQMLTANTESTALDNYPPPPPQQGGFGSGLGAGLSHNGSSGCENHLSLPPPSAAETLQCTGVGWSCSGAVLVACFGRLDMDGWCSAHGVLAAWPVFRRDFDPHAAPEVVVEHSSCLMSLACHPNNPALIAAGSFNGEVLIIDLSRATASTRAPGNDAVNGQDQDDNGDGSNPVAFCSQIDDYFHREPVKSVEWVWDSEEGAFALASVSADGKVLLWQVKHGLKYPTRGTKLNLLRSDGGRAQAEGAGGVYGTTHVAFARVGGGGGSAAQRKANAFTTGTVQSSTMVVGSDTGSVLACPPPPPRPQIPAVSPQGLEWDSAALKVLEGVSDSEGRNAVRSHVERWAREHSDLHAAGRPIDPHAIFRSKPDPDVLFNAPGRQRGGVGRVVKLEGHAGPVLGLEMAPFHRHLLASCGADSRLKLSSLLQTKPLLTLETAAQGGAEGPPVLHGVVWSHTRPLVLAVCTAPATPTHGQVLVFDLGVSTHLPVATIKAHGADKGPAAAAAAKAGPKFEGRHGGGGGGAVHSVAFNPKMRAFLAFGDADGHVHTARLPPSLADSAPGEAAILQALVAQLSDSSVGLGESD